MPFQYRTKTLPEHKVKTNDPIEDRVTHVMSYVAHLNPSYRYVFMMVYRNILKMLSKDEELARHLENGDMYVVFKGTNSLVYLNPGVFPKLSDFDFVICINPSLETFNEVFNKTSDVIKNVISFFKQHIDKVFGFHPHENVKVHKAFMHDVVCALKKIDGVIHPFQHVLDEKPDDVRKMSSSSFLYTRGEDNAIVRTDVPSLDSKIFMKRSPVFCSLNETISFDRDEKAEKKGHFNLYRVRMMFQHEGRRKKSNIVDITLFHKDDYELQAFWDNRAHVQTVRDKVCDVTIYSADLHIAEMERILNEYKCDEVMKEKLEGRLAMMKNFLSEANSKDFRS